MYTMYIGTFTGLCKDHTYYIHVLQQQEQLLLDQIKTKQNYQNYDPSPNPSLSKLDGRFGLESCSCVYGNPCVDEYGCKDWGHRYAISMTNGWKGF